MYDSSVTGLVLFVDYRKEAPAFEYGDRITTRDLLQGPKGASHPGEFDCAAYLARQGIYATLSIWDGGRLENTLGRAPDSAQEHLGMRMRLRAFLEKKKAVRHQNRRIPTRWLEQQGFLSLSSLLAGQRTL